MEPRSSYDESRLCQKRNGPFQKVPIESSIVLPQYLVDDMAWTRLALLFWSVTLKQKNEVISWTQLQYPDDTVARWLKNPNTFSVCLWTSMSTIYQFE
jgi:hypothetical protein